MATKRPKRLHEQFVRDTSYQAQFPTGAGAVVHDVDRQTLSDAVAYLMDVVPQSRLPDLPADLPRLTTEAPVYAIAPFEPAIKGYNVTASFPPVFITDRQVLALKAVLGDYFAGFVFHLDPATFRTKVVVTVRSRTCPLGLRKPGPLAIVDVDDGYGSDDDGALPAGPTPPRPTAPAPQPSAAPAGPLDHMTPFIAGGGAKR